MNHEHVKIRPWDERRNLLISENEIATLDVCIRHFVSTCKNSIEKHGSFKVALSGGSTPKFIYEHLAMPPYTTQIEWEKVHLFWGDERNVQPTDPNSNYKLAMDAGLSKVPIPKKQIHRMKGEDPIKEHAEAYDTLLRRSLSERPFDLVILGMGEDGHTASLFPQTDGLKVEDKMAIANYIPQKNTWRMTLTYPVINNAQEIVIYVIGDSKKHTLKEVLVSNLQVDRYPIQKIGTKDRPALWIVDEAAASELPEK